METAPSNWAIREVEEADVPFIFSSWLKSYREAYAVRFISNTVYYAQHHAAIERVLRRAGSFVLVCCDKDDPSQIFGYAVCEKTTSGGVFHWVYCKHPFRGFGIARALEQTAAALMEGPISYTHCTRAMESISKRRDWVYQPYLFWSNV